MSNSKSESYIRELLAKADIQVGGSRPWDIVVHNQKFYAKVLTGGSIGIGEAYVNGWWDTPALDQCFCKILRSALDSKISPVSSMLASMKARVINLQNRKRADKASHKHYDLSLALFESFLDPYKQYTCGYFQGTNDLNKAQRQKLDLICKKLQLKKTDKVLDIGCGWGGFDKYAAEKYGCHVTGVNVSREQTQYGAAWTKNLPVKIIRKDYRDIEGKFDKILVCGLMEHVGYKNFRALIQVARRCLKKDGLFLLHTIAVDRSTKIGDPWLEKYIFPDALLPSAAQIVHAAENLFVIEDWQNFGSYYDKTLMAWHKNFTKNWETIKNKYDKKFYRMWTYYLLGCAGSFRARRSHLYQIVFSKKGIQGGYQSIR